MVKGAGATRARGPSQATPARGRTSRQESPPVETVLGLQRQAGNQATSQLLALQRLGGSPATDPMLRWGSRGAAVQVLQDHLVQSGAAIAVDGIFGPITRQAVVLYQTNAGLSADGVVGPKTWAALKTGGTQIPAEQAPGKAFSASDLGDRLASRLRMMATHLGQIAGGGSVGGGVMEPFAPLSGFAELLEPLGAAGDAGELDAADAGAGGGGVSHEFGPEPGGDVGSPGAPPGDVAETAFEVLSIMQQLDPTIRGEMGKTAAAIDAVVPGLAAPGGLATQNTLTQLDTIVTDLGEFAANQTGASTGSGSSGVEVKNDTTYKIKGTTIADVGQELDAHMAIHGEAAHVAATGNQGASVSYVLNANGTVKAATIKLDLDRVLPEWTNASSTTCACWKKEWDRFDVAIKAHEQEHVNIFKRFYTGLHLKVVGKTQAKANELIDAEVAKAEKAQTDFDTNTKHGTVPAPGTNFDAGKSCTC